MKMVKVIIIFSIIAAISFFVGKYFWVRTPTDTKIECEGTSCPVPEEYKVK